MRQGPFGDKTGAVRRRRDTGPLSDSAFLPRFPSAIFPLSVRAFLGLIQCRTRVAASFLLLAAFATVAFSAAPALAAAPEVPTAEPPSEVKAETARLRGTLDPGKEGEQGTFEIGTYEFLYKESATECQGGLKAPEFAEVSHGAGKEEVSLEVAGLKPHSEYAVCLVARNEAGTEETVSAPVTFKTALPPETPETTPATAITATTATLNGTLNPGGAADAGSYQFLYRASSTECEGGGRTPEPSGTAAGHKEEAVAAGLTHLLPVTEYTACLLARNDAGEAALGSPVSFTTPAASPTVEDESSPKLGATTATLSATIDAGGLPTRYQLEYVTETQFAASGFAEAFRVPTPDAALAASPIPVAVRQEITGLVTGGIYRFRFTATNSLGSQAGEAQAFSTNATEGPPSLTLPDSRAYELVSSAAENQDVYVPSVSFDNERLNSTLPFRASADGNAVAYLADPPQGSGTGSIGNGEGNQLLAQRQANGWSSSDILPSTTNSNTRFESFSGDLSLQILRSPSPACAELSSRDSNTESFRTLFVTSQTPSLCDRTSYAGASADGHHLLFENEGALTPGAMPGEGEEVNHPAFNLYDTVAGHVYQVNILPNGDPQTIPNATFGAQETGGDQPNFGQVVSSDGSRVLWTDLGGTATTENPSGATRLFERINDTQPQSPVDSHDVCTVPSEACTVQLDAVQDGALGSSGGGRFWAATGDGSKVLFSDCNKLTANATARPTGECGREEPGVRDVSKGEDLYEYDLASGRLTDLTIDSNGGDVLGADVQGVVGTSEDGSYVYFVAGGALAAGASPRTCRFAEGGTAKEEEEHNAEEDGRLPAGRGCNLYVLHKGEATRFIAALSYHDDNLQANGESATVGHTGDWNPGLGGRTAQVTPDGRNLVFRSTVRLTGYDNRGASPLPGVPEVFVYDQAQNEITCASCSPSGAPPTEDILVGPQSGVTYAFGAFLPVSYQATYMHRLISDDGTRVFFDTSQALVPRDTNRREDVYEWERNGSGSCTRGGGCRDLISGASNGPAYLVDASADGSDVFFTSGGQLIPAAINETVALYDARVGGGFPSPSLACTGAGCQSPASVAPAFANPPTATFSGTGNASPTSPIGGIAKKKTLTRRQRLINALKGCRKRRSQRARTSCERQARKRYGPRHRPSGHKAQQRAGK